MAAIMAGEATPAQIGGFLVALRIKGETPDEIAGFAECDPRHGLLVRAAARRPRRLAAPAATASRRSTSRPAPHCWRPPPARASPSTATGRSRRPPARPTCWRRSASRSSCRPERIARSIDELGFGFLFAPTHHPGLRHAAPVRRELATRTVFNVLGPLTNPAGARAQIVGVYSPELVRTIAEVLARLGARRAFVVHGACGVDELSPAGPNHVCEVVDGGVRRARDRSARARRAPLRARGAAGRVAGRERGGDPRDLLGRGAGRAPRRDPAQRLGRDRRRRARRRPPGRPGDRPCGTRLRRRRGAPRRARRLLQGRRSDGSVSRRPRRARPRGRRRGQAPLAVGRRPAPRRRPGRARGGVRATRAPRRSRSSSTSASRARSTTSAPPAPPRRCRCSRRASSATRPSSTS